MIASLQLRGMRCAQEYLVITRFFHSRLQAHCTMTVNCNLEVVVSSLKLASVTLFELLSGWKSVHIIDLVIRELVAQISIQSELMYAFKQLRTEASLIPCGIWVSMSCHHLAASMSRICLLRFLLSSCTSFDRARGCSSYFRIWKQMSKLTTYIISSSVRLIIGQVCACMVLLYSAMFLQWTLDTEETI
jgi:hypothetical protein